MKQLIGMLLCLLLCGCTQQASASLPEIPPETQASPATAGMYDPDHPMERAYPGQVRAYPLTLRKVHGIRALGNDVLTLSGYGTTTLTLLTGENLYEKASLTLDFSLEQEDVSLQMHENSISYFDPTRSETVVLDHRLQEIRRIKVPEELSGKPILSPDGNTLFYCTGWSVVAWNLQSGIRRTLKELAYEAQELTGLHRNGQILACSILDKDVATTLLLSADLGADIRTLPENAVLNTGDDHYFTVFPSGYQTLLIFGDPEKSPELLLPKTAGQQQFYLPEDHAAITVTSAEDGNTLDYYELSTGFLRASLILDSLQTPRGIANSKGHSIYILTYDPAADCDVLYRWDVLRQTPDPASSVAYKTRYHSIDDPDLEGLELCREYAKAIGETYGIQIQIWNDALAVQPWDYRFEPEYLVPILEKELQSLEQRLAKYPDGMLRQTKDHFAGLTICLVRNISGIGAERSLSNPTGIQFFDGNQAYVVITTGKHSEQALYHELYHVMETHLLTKSSALDLWETLNPADFIYGVNSQNMDIYLQGQTRAFVDRYSMGYPKEDRARILENAMLEGKHNLFQSEYMQRKLRTLCSGLREAYGFKKYPEILPWEQYLVNPLTPKA